MCGDLGIGQRLTIDEEAGRGAKKRVHRLEKQRSVRLPAIACAVKARKLERKFKISRTTGGITLSRNGKGRFVFRIGRDSDTSGMVFGGVEGGKSVPG